MSHHEVCRMNCGTTPSRETLTQNHGTPAEFAEAIWAACDQLFITPGEAARGIRDYAREWHAAPEAAEK